MITYLKMTILMRLQESNMGTGDIMRKSFPAFYRMNKIPNRKHLHYFKEGTTMCSRAVIERNLQPMGVDLLDLSETLLT